MAGAEACLSRVYSNASRGVTVSVLLLGGLPGDIAVHTPDICYPGAGYTLGATSPFQRHDGPDLPAAEFRTALATRQGTNPSILRIFWGWNATNTKGWSAPEAPRWKFAAAPALCKLYLVRETAGVVVDPKDDSCNDFMSVFLPELDKLVFASK